MEEELSLDNILGAEEIDNLFTEDDETQETPTPENNEEETTNKGEKNGV